jgi:hypothetical protein
MGKKLGAMCQSFFSNQLNLKHKIILKLSGRLNILKTNVEILKYLE